VKELKKVAVAYAQNDLRVLPLNSKRPITAHGSTDATTDEGKISKWWEAHPDADIGIATGKKSNIFVLDVDRKNGGFESLYALQEKIPALKAETVCVETIMSPGIQTGQGHRLRCLT
jgi:hypothetical protein